MFESDDNKYERASIEAWELAVWHAEQAQETLENISRLYWLAQQVIEDHQVMASFFLALGGYGEDTAAYSELGLHFEPNKMVRENELNLISEEYYINEEEDDEEDERF
jgi:hypothetical protein